jgi:hypothetical protein
MRQMFRQVGRILACAVLACLLAGCARFVYVTDPQGAPLADASIQQIDQPLTTDFQGRAFMGTWQNPLRPSLLVIEKKGYRSVQMSFPNQWPAYVTLHPEEEPAAPAANAK